jgi:NTP pyrophosphatase (non-canonical NTP hydrolase)
MKMSNELEKIMHRQFVRSKEDIISMSSLDGTDPTTPLTTTTTSTSTNTDPITTEEIGIQISQEELERRYRQRLEELEREHEQKQKEQKHKKPLHKDLKGRERLYSVVKFLEKSCPWTISLASRQMLQWLRSELDELEKELKLLDHWKQKRMHILNKSNNSNSNKKYQIGENTQLTVKKNEKGNDHDHDDDDHDDDDHDKKIESIKIGDAKYKFLVKSLTSEMGDILFDALMLEMMIRR